jgi:hypothetical protein
METTLRFINKGSVTIEPFDNQTDFLSQIKGNDIYCIHNKKFNYHYPIRKDYSHLDYSFLKLLQEIHNEIGDQIKTEVEKLMEKYSYIRVYSEEIQRKFPLPEPSGVYKCR